MQSIPLDDTRDPHGDPICKIPMPSSLSQMMLNSQGRIQPQVAEEAREKHANGDRHQKHTDLAAEMHIGWLATRGVTARSVPLTTVEIMGLPDQDITDTASGKFYLERTLLTPPGVSWSVESLSSALLQITQLKGITHLVTNTLCSVTFILNQLDVDTKGDKIASTVNAQLVVHTNTLMQKAQEVTAQINKAAAEAVALVAVKVDTAVNEITRAFTTITAATLLGNS